MINLDITDDYGIRDSITEIQLTILNFANQSFVDGMGLSIQTWDTDATSVLHMLEYSQVCTGVDSIMGSSEEFSVTIGTKPPTKFKSHMGRRRERSSLVRVYRESYDLYAVQGGYLIRELVE